MTGCGTGPAVNVGVMRMTARGPGRAAGGIVPEPRGAQAPGPPPEGAR